MLLLVLGQKQGDLIMRGKSASIQANPRRRHPTATHWQFRVLYD